MGAVGGLRFDRWIPPRIEMNDGIGGGKIQADAASFQTDQEDGNRGIALESIHDFLTLFGGTIEIAEWNLELLQAFTDEVQHRDELAKHKNAMFAVDRFLEQLVQQVQLGGGLRGSASFELAFWWGVQAGSLRSFKQPQIATHLAQTEQTGEHLYPLRTGIHFCTGTAETLLNLAQ